MHVSQTKYLASSTVKLPSLLILGHGSNLSQWQCPLTPVDSDGVRVVIVSSSSLALSMESLEVAASALGEFRQECPGMVVASA